MHGFCTQECLYHYSTFSLSNGRALPEFDIIIVPTSCCKANYHGLFSSSPLPAPECCHVSLRLLAALRMETMSRVKEELGPPQSRGAYRNRSALKHIILSRMPCTACTGRPINNAPLCWTSKAAKKDESIPQHSLARPNRRWRCWDRPSPTRTERAPYE